MTIIIQYLFQYIPTNVFIVAACNPYRGNSQIFTLGKDSENDWLRASYYVQPLAPTLELLKWSYGALRKEDEHEYVLEKLKLCSNEVKNEENNEQVSEEKYLLRFLATLIHKGQTNLREYAYEQLCNLHGEELKKEDAKMYATSCVSQRDIQRVFILYEWLLGWFKNSNHYSDNDFSQRVRATFVSIGIAYYFRLNSEYREKFKTEMDKSTEISPQRGTSLRFSKVLQDELDKMIENFKLPSRIAATQALKENIYATVVCILTKTPLIIVGPPGSSKTVSIKIISSCLRGIHSESNMFQNEEFFPPVDQHSYQCSRRSNSTEIEALFKHAINHKNMLDEVGIKNCTVVVMDEAGLTEESHESLKVLHYYLDKHEVHIIIMSSPFTQMYINVYNYSEALIVILITVYVEKFNKTLTRAWAEGYSDRSVCLSVCLCVYSVSVCLLPDILRKYCVLCMKQYGNRKSTYYSVKNMWGLLQNHFV